MSARTPPTLPRRKLPIGIQTFAKIREEDYYYMDKTGLALQQPIHLVGVEFSKASRHVVWFEVDTLHIR